MAKGVECPVDVTNLSASMAVWTNQHSPAIQAFAFRVAMPFASLRLDGACQSRSGKNVRCSCQFTRHGADVSMPRRFAKRKGPGLTGPCSNSDYSKLTGRSRAGPRHRVQEQPQSGAKLPQTG